MTAPGSFDAAITAALDAQAGHLLNLTVEVCSCGRPWVDVRDWARHRMAEGLRAALDVLGYGPSGGSQTAVAASEPSEGRSGGTGASESVSGLRIGRDGPLRPPQSPLQPRTDAESPAASPDHPDAAETGTAPRAHKLRIGGPDQYGYYRGRCACGWPGSPWENRRDVRAEYDRHLTADTTQED